MFKMIMSITASIIFISTPLRAETPSERIAKAVDAFSNVALSGVEEVKVTPAKTVKEMLFALALQKGYSTDESDFSWVDNSSDAWEGDSSNFGEETMKGAYAYITTLDSSYDEDSSPEGLAAKKKALDEIKKAKVAFKLLLGSGVKFGVVPFGAVQCGFTFAALAIIDPATGTVYIMSKEPSGC